MQQTQRGGHQGLGDSRLPHQPRPDTGPAAGLASRAAPGQPAERCPGQAGQAGGSGSVRSPARAHGRKREQEPYLPYSSECPPWQEHTSLGEKELPALPCSLPSHHFCSCPFSPSAPKLHFSSLPACPHSPSSHPSLPLCFLCRPDPVQPPAPLLLGSQAFIAFHLFSFHLFNFISFPYLF